MKASVILSIVWLIIFLLTCKTNIAENFWGKGRSVIGKEYYRFITAGLLHTNIIHVLGNVYMILWLGKRYESYIGSWKYLSIGGVGAILTSFIFLCIYNNAQSSYGGSAVVYTIAGFILVSQFVNLQFPVLDQKWMVFYLLIYNIPILTNMGWGTVTYHIIALSLGVVVGALEKLI